MKPPSKVLVSHVLGVSLICIDRRRLAKGRRKSTSSEFAEACTLKACDVDPSCAVVCQDQPRNAFDAIAKIRMLPNLHTLSNPRDPPISGRLPPLAPWLVLFRKLLSLRLRPPNLRQSMLPNRRRPGKPPNCCIDMCHLFSI